MKNEKALSALCKTGFSKTSPPDVGPLLVMVSVAESARAAGKGDNSPAREKTPGELSGF